MMPFPVVISKSKMKNEGKKKMHLRKYMEESIWGVSIMKTYPTIQD